MFVRQGCNDDKAVIESFKEALRQRVGAERYQLWFCHGVDFVLAPSNAAPSKPDSSSTDLGSTDLESADPESVAAELSATESSSQRTTPRDRVMMVRVRGQFALDRIRNHWIRELRGAAMQVCGSAAVELCLDQPATTQSELPLPGLEPLANGDEVEPVPSAGGRAPGRRRNHRAQSRRKAAGRSTSKRGQTRSFSSLVADGAGDAEQNRPSGRESHLPTQLELPNLVVPESQHRSVGSKPLASGQTLGDGSSSPTAGRQPKSNRGPIGSQAAGSHAASAVELTVDSFIVGSSNQLAHTAMAMICQDPRASSPLFVCGPTGSGKSHILQAIADQFRRRHRMKRVMVLSAEQFTNDFISSCGNTGIAAFRRRYREVDALLIDGMQFLGAKTATLREMLYTVETLISSGRPLVASGISSPGEIQGLTSELAGRLAAGLVCPLQPIDMVTRETLLRREIDQRCPLEMPDATIEMINSTLSGDGRIIRGVANLINTLQRMNGRVPSIDELRRYGGDLLRSAQPVATLTVIESAVCQAFQLPADTLRGGAQTRAVTEPRMLAMYLSRQLTSSAYTEIARHFGGRSHSTAISAEKNVKKWLANQKAIGRGNAAMSTQEAIDRIESLLRTG